MTKKVTVIVEGREYIVEVGDLAANPVIATVNQKDYQVQVPGGSESSPASVSTPEPAKPAPSPKQAVPAAPTPVQQGGGDKAITAPMPGDILSVEVQPGTSVNVGDVVCVLEAMKMKNMIRAARAGIVATVDVTPGQAVDYGAVLVTFE
jgi:biotin carboxyl carrier protein